MRARLLSGVLFIMIGSLTLFLATCDKTVNSGFEDSIELYSYLEPIEGASNATMIVNKGNDDNDSYFQVEISDIETNHLLKSGSHGAWCLEWRKPMRSNNDEHKGVKWYSSIGNPKWKPMNYFFSIKSELEAADPSLTYREFQAVVWSLAGYMGIAPEFDVETLPDSELPGDLRTDGQPNFSKQKVLAIVDRVKSKYSSPAKFKSTEEEGCIVGETEEDQQNVCVPTEPEILIETISAGGNHSCGLDSNGQAYCWGLNSSGQIGDGTTTRRLTPVAVNMPTGISFVEISAGGTHTVALDLDGNAWAWGLNSRGQLGDGTVNSRLTPTEISMPAGVNFTKINAGRAFTVALTTTGEAYSWGINDNGELGDGTTTGRLIPGTVNMPTGINFTAISASRHTVALATSGDAYSWGFNRNGELGDGTTINRSTPVLVSMPSEISFTAISAGGVHTISLDSNGNAWGWGLNGAGEVGDGTRVQRLLPVPVSMPEGISFTKISTGNQHSSALASTGEAYSWGNDGNGRLGTGGSNSFSTTPVEVVMPSGTSFIDINTFGAGSHNLALSSSGIVWTWGFNIHGQLGDGTTEDRSTPVEVLFPLP